MGARGAIGARGAAGAAGAARGSSGRSGGKARPTREAPAASLPGYTERDLPSWHDEQFQGKLDEIKAIGDDVVALQRKRAALDEQIKEKNTLARSIIEDIDDSGSWSVRDDDWTCSYVKPKDRETIVRELLIQAGVTMKQIEKGTKRTPVTPFVSFLARKEAK